MACTIGEVAKKLSVPTSTVRYYDREGLLRTLGRSDGGIRVFTESDIDQLKMINCLKKTGMPIKDIRQFMEWCEEGDSTLEKRREMFYQRRHMVEEQIAELQSTLDTINYKCWFYELAVAEGDGNAPLRVAPEDMPAEIKRAYENM